MNLTCSFVKIIGISLFILAVVAGLFAYTSRHNGVNIATGNKDTQLPEKFQNISNQQDALSKLGEPKSKSVNTKWENKTKDEWLKLEKEASDLESAANNPYASTGKDSSYSKLLNIRRSLSHKAKENWFYPAGDGSENGYIFQFDAEGNVIRMNKYNKPHADLPKPPGKH